MPVEKRDFSCKRNERDIYSYIIRAISTQVNEIFRKFIEHLHAMFWSKATDCGMI